MKMSIQNGKQYASIDLLLFGTNLITLGNFLFIIIVISFMVFLIKPHLLQQLSTST